MKHVIIIVALLFTTLSFGQYKDDISVVQFSAKFLVEKQISLKKFKEFNTYTLFMSDHSKFFKEEKVEYLPTIIVYNNGDVVLRIDGGMSLELPEDTIKQIQRQLTELQSNKF
tara:strand:+ start:853 stop:1191 length:339 start_codon:yes stop_codon:yes gene_type:complete